MDHILDLDRYPLDKPGTNAWNDLVQRCREDMARGGMFNLEGFMRPEALERAMAEIEPVMDTLSFVHKRHHNCYFRDHVDGLSPDHPALQKVDTINHTVCWDQIPMSVPAWVYEWPQFAVFLAATLDKKNLFTMRDPLARMNIMKYGDGEALNWHFDRSEFTTTLLLQEPSGGGRSEYRSNLRTDDDPNYDGVAAALEGRDPDLKSFDMTAGTLNVFRGKNTLHRVTKCTGPQARYIAVFSYYERPAVTFSKEEQMGFYGRAA
ncbi:HalD/BesD family halogenase [Chachezhania sediminis]|uniref:HalD/BesD family halogenase n=1 Tax=Chachezhania sediminis TaxID=2599291 RepID=UPI00131E90B9|nr:2OG-Fe(II) oxygenase [Chachezhania sediminis]